VQADQAPPDEPRARSRGGRSRARPWLPWGRAREP
jgi:hypothetical protein